MVAREQHTDPAHEARGVSALVDVDARFQHFVNHDGAVNFEIPTAIEGYQFISNAVIPFKVSPGNHEAGSMLFLTMARKSIQQKMKK